MKLIVNRSKVLSLLLIFVLMASTLGFGQTVNALPSHVPDQAKNNAANEVRDVTVTPQEVTLAQGETIQLEALVTYSNGSSNSKVDWATSDATIASVSKTGVVQASASHSGIVTITATGSRGRSSMITEVQVTVYNPENSIANARTKIGETVTVNGVVNVDNYQLQAGRLNVYIQDPTAGIQLFSFNPQNFDELREGDYVQVTGQVGVYTGVTQITVDELQVLERDKPLQAKAVNIAELANTDLAETLQGQLVTLEGYFQTVPTYYLGGANISAIDEDFHTLLIRVWETTGITLEAIEPANWYEITGIMSKYNDTYQLLPRKAADIVLAEEQKDRPSTNKREFVVTVDRVVDGDTIRIVEPVFGATNVRFLNIDTAETYHAVRNDLDQHQMDHGKRAGEYLRNYLSDGDTVIVRLGEEPLDSYGRLLAEVITLDGINTNLEMVRQGQAVTYFIYPFENERVMEYAAAARYARDNQLGIWNPADPLLEEPFVFRSRERGESGLSRYVGHIETKEYVLPNQYAAIPAEYRVFFTEDEALSLGYTQKNLTDTELAIVDRNGVMLHVLAHHNITRLTHDLSLPSTGRYGSNVVWQSSHPDVVSHNGVINKSLEEDTSALLTATITHGNAQQILELEVTVLKPTIALVSWSFDGQSALADGGLAANANRAIRREAAVSPTFPQGSGGNGTYAYNTNGWHDGAFQKYYQIDFETIGFRNIKLSSKQMGSNTGPQDFTLQYSLDGVQWTDLGDIVVANNWTSGVVQELALPDVLENREAVYIRWLMSSNTSINGGTVASGGTSRIDDIIITGNPMSLTDEEAVQLDRHNLEIIFQGSDQHDAVTEDIFLASTGINGSSISWDSSHPEWINAFGHVTRPENEDVQVTLTATLTKGAAVATKTFNLVVVALSSTPPSEVEPLIGYWHFNDSFANHLTGGGVLAANVGNALLSTNFMNLAEFQGDSLNALPGYIAGNALSLVGNANNGHYVELVFSTFELEAIEISFATRGTATGFNTHQWMYSFDGIHFEAFGENTANTTASWQLKHVALPAVADNQEMVFVRVYFDGATGSSGNNRIDNLQINGTIIE